MTPYRIVSHCLLNPQVVIGPGRYVTRSGDVVTVDEVERFQAFGSYENGIKERWMVSGHLFTIYASQNDIVRSARQPEEPEHWAWKLATGSAIALCLLFAASVVVGFIALLIKL